MRLTTPHLSRLSSSPLPQLPSDPVHREPLQRPTAEEDGPVPGGDPWGQAGPVQRQGRRVGPPAFARDPPGQDPSQGKRA